MSVKTTESESRFSNLDKMNTLQLLEGINQEDQQVAVSVQKVLPVIQKMIDAIYPRMAAGGRLFYLGAGTSGRLGIVDASECPPTFGVPHGVVVGLIAGGDAAIRKAVEFAEDDREQGWKDLQEYAIRENDSVIGITASGSTPYVLGALEQCNLAGIFTGGICCNGSSLLAQTAMVCIECVVGPEFITGSTRMKSGTAQKMILNMISSTLMIKLGHVKGNRMVDMQLSNHKLIDRGTKMVMEATGLTEEKAREALLRYGSVRKAIEKVSE